MKLPINSAKILAMHIPCEVIALASSNDNAVYASQKRLLQIPKYTLASVFRKR